MDYKKISFPPEWTPEHEEGWRRDPAGVWQTLEEMDRQKKKRLFGGSVPFTDKL